MTTTSNTPLHQNQSTNQTQSQTIAHSIDRYNGILIGTKDIEATIAQHASQHTSTDFESYFKQLLHSSLQQWSASGRTGCLIDLPLSQSAQCIQALHSEGFVCHHAEGQIICLTLWLPNWALQHASKPDSPPARPPSPSMIPSYPFTSLGCGSFVVRRNGDVLVITELRSHVPDFWKLSGGALDRNEDISVCAVREVKEETGIDCKFVSLIGFRHIIEYNTRQNTADLYFLAVCTVDEEVDHRIAIQAKEIAKCKWMPLIEFLRLPSAQWMASTVKSALFAEVESIYPHLAPALHADLAIPIPLDPKIQVVQQSDQTGVNLIPRLVRNPVRNTQSTFYVVNHSNALKPQTAHQQQQSASQNSTQSKI